MKKLFFFFILSGFLFVCPSRPIAANTFIKVNQNPILSPGPDNWDSKAIWLPTIVYDGHEYKMWYVGDNGSGYQIGLAHSYDGINFNKDPHNPVFSKLSDHKNVDSPFVLYYENQYHMWYSEFDSGSTSKINYVTSNDGISWTPNSTVVPFIPTTGFGTNGVMEPTVVKEDSGYKMWFTSSDGNWSMGMATSEDGKIWSSYSNNPVLRGDNVWDGTQVVGPSVLIDQGIYKMWYNSNSNNQTLPSTINFASSVDGVNWEKTADYNPVISRGSGTSFDAKYIAEGSIINVNGTNMIYYVGIDSLSNTTRIGLAVDGPIPTPPPPPPTTKVVVIPGFGASWNGDALLNCKESGYSGDWVMNPVADSIYQPLFSALSTNSLISLPYYYDWRKQIASHALPLVDFIDSRTIPNERVHLVGHSMGGLVGRGYLESQGTNNRIDHLLTAGSPHQGVPFAYPAWAGGEIWDDNFLMRVAMTTAVNICGKKYLMSDAESIHRFFPSAQNLLPTYNFLRDKQTDQLKIFDSMVNKNNWLPNQAFTYPFYGVTVGSLNGTGIKTLQSLIVKDPTKKQDSLGLWADGASTGKEYSISGDGAVLDSSSVIPGATNISLNKNHTELVQSSEADSAIINFLKPASQAVTDTTQTSQEPTTALVVMSYPAVFSVTTPNGTSFHDRDGIIGIVNPKKGNYKFVFQPKTANSTFIIAQFLKNGKTLWKEYKHEGIVPVINTIAFDPDNPQEDALK